MHRYSYAVRNVHSHRIICIVLCRVRTLTVMFSPYAIILCDGTYLARNLRVERSSDFTSFRKTNEQVVPTAKLFRRVREKRVQLSWVDFYENLLSFMRFVFIVFKDIKLRKRWEYIYIYIYTRARIRND